MTRSSPHESFLRYRSFRWLKVAVLLVVVSVVAYVADAPLGGRRGDTPVGYALGIVSALLMIWLTWFGVRKRSYRSAGAPVRGWLSAHVYLGATLLLLVPLHCAFAFGWNVHTLAYALMAATIATGLVGLVFYGSVPEQMTANRPGEKLSSLIRQVGEIDADCRKLAAEMPDVFAGAVTIAIDQTRIGGGLLAQLRGRDPHCGTARALALVQQHARDVRGPMRARRPAPRIPVAQGRAAGADPARRAAQVAARPVARRARPARPRGAGGGRGPRLRRPLLVSRCRSG